MNDEVSAFFDGLGRRKHVPSLERLTATLRVDAEDVHAVERWLVRVDRGDVRVSRRMAKANCTVRADRDTLRAIVVGRLNVLAAVLRGVVGIDGDLNALVLFQRAFPRPPQRSAGGKTVRTSVEEAP